MKLNKNVGRQNFLRLINIINLKKRIPNLALVLLGRDKNFLNEIDLYEQVHLFWI